MKYRLAYLMISLALLCFENALRAAEPMPIVCRTNIAHRGASAIAPENTLAAFRQAITDGASGCECDVYKSADGVAILIHDKTTKRTLGGGDDDVTKLTFEELRKRDAGVWKGEHFRNEKIPTLDEYLDLLRGTSCHPVIEIKMDGIEKTVLDAVRKRDMLAETVIIAFSANVVKEIRRLEPNICVGYLYSEKLEGNAGSHADRLADILLRRSNELDTPILSLNHTLLSEKLVRRLKEAGKHVWCWTVNDAARMNTVLDWGVESVTTDKPDVLTDVLKQRMRSRADK